MLKKQLDPKQAAANLQRYNAELRSLREARLGALADFKLFDSIAVVWLAHNRRTWALKDHYELNARRMAGFERRLGEKLVELVKANDLRSLARVLDSIELLRRQPRKTAGLFAASDDKRFEVERAFLTLSRSQRRAPTINELYEHLVRERGFGIHEKTLRRACEKYGLKYTPDKVGRRPSLRPRKK